MKSPADLRTTLRRIEGKGYKGYRDMEGAYDWGEFILFVDHVQGDPFASPSLVRVRVPQRVALFPDDTYSSSSREVVLRDFLTRRFLYAAKRFCRGNRGTGSSGIISIDRRPGQEILERTSVLVNGAHIEARFVMGLPAHGRTVAASHAQAMFFDELPQIVRASLFFRSLDEQMLRKHIEVAEDADSLRSQLEGLGLVAFVADGAILPRASGIDPRPLRKGLVVPFESPQSLRVKLESPNHDTITGMGIAKGVTLIVGGGYHGKSTLLRALELGVYNHIPGDGREFVVTNPYAMKIRAEDGRRIEGVDMSPFIANLPLG
jgi:predicted ABC-class ATPase